jgi:hypothetical protein
MPAIIAVITRHDMGSTTTAQAVWVLAGIAFSMMLIVRHAAPSPSFYRRRIGRPRFLMLGLLYAAIAFWPGLSTWPIAHLPAQGSPLQAVIFCIPPVSCFHPVLDALAGKVSC